MSAALIVAIGGGVAMVAICCCVCCFLLLPAARRRDEEEKAQYTKLPDGRTMSVWRANDQGSVKGDRRIAPPAATPRRVETWSMNARRQMVRDAYRDAAQRPSDARLPATQTSTSAFGLFAAQASVAFDGASRRLLDERPDGCGTRRRARLDASSSDASALTFHSLLKSH